MILYEFEGKKLLQGVGINVPKSQLITSAKDKLTLALPMVLKAQVLSGKRAKAGGIIKINQGDSLKESIKSLLRKKINGEAVDKILAEESVEIDKEYYFSISYDTDYRQPVMTISIQGGTGVEEKESKIFPINVLDPQQAITQVAGLSGLPEDFLQKVLKLFFDADCLLLEINPVVKTNSGDYLALDAKVKLDDAASQRHPEWQYPTRSAPGHTPTVREIEAKKIDEGDYRGVAGSAFFDLDGDIAVLASGGGASLAAMDTLIKAGGKPANYTEYGGNPPKEKVFKLTQIILSKPNLHGLWVVGALANFTDIYETLSGFIDGLRQAEKDLKTKFDFPIVIRRAGPRDEEARQMLQQVKDFKIHLYGEEISITKSAEIIVELAKKYAT